MSRTLVRVFLLVLVLVAGVSSFPPEASAQLVDPTVWKQNPLLDFDVTTLSLTGTAVQQTVRVKAPSSRNWMSTLIVACSWTTVEPTSKSFPSSPTHLAADRVQDN